MRCDQYIGLNDWARAKVSETHKVREVGTRILPGGVVEPFDRTINLPVAKVEKVGEIHGAWTDVVATLSRYTLPNGEVLTEYVQAEPWSSGPCYFVALKDAKGKPVPQSLWSDDDLNNC